MKNHQAHGKKQWYCSSRDVHGCRADVITYKGVDGTDYISIFRGRHIHNPPRLRQCHDGIYYLPSHRTGSMVMIFKDNKFWINNRYQNTINWTCRDRKRLGCSSCVQTTSEGRYIRSNKFELLMLNNYTYGRHYELKHGTRWRCSKKCAAYLVVNKHGQIIKKQDQHSHPPDKQTWRQEQPPSCTHELSSFPSAVCDNPYFSVLMVKGRHGKDLLMLNGYTYYQHKLLRDGFRWSCTQMGSRSCRGFLHVTGEMLVIRAQTEHTHPPSTYFLEKFKSRVKSVSF
ncbi:Uncharacterized protein OBRU01_15537 [Operophtera brumata]|uniref:FLYWCH-type domain-containing protein n=1 Tax=Operophtera brumata TaxID=104452 RepID=A0A0L7L477_OPEBR|nr:Uncharacterized protein OBRU01_15537 [Operophtera brumata]